MKISINYLFLFIIFSIQFVIASTQMQNGTSDPKKRIVDSLKARLEIEKNDTSKVNTLLVLERVMATYQNSEGLEDSYKYTHEALALSEKLNYKEGQIIAWCDLGAYEESKNADFSAALIYYYKAIAIAEKLGNNAITFERYGQVLNACFYLGDYPKAMETALKGLALAEKTNVKNDIAHYYSLLGYIYANQNNYAKAKENYTKYLKLAEETGNENMLAHAYTGMTDVFSQEGNFKLALEYQFKTLDLYLKMDAIKQKAQPGYSGFRQLIAFTYNNIASLYQAMKDNKTALHYSEKCLKLALDVGVNKYELVNYYLTNGSLYTQQNEFNKAETALLNGLRIADSIAHKENIKSCYLNLAQLYSAKKDFKKAFEFHTKYSDLKDTLLNEKNSRQLTEMNMRFETAKKDKELIKKDAEIKEQQLEANQQSTLRNAFIIGFILVLLLALFILRGYRQKQKANEVITKQKEEVEHKNEIIEEKQKEIIDSINYAKRIQYTLLAHDQFLKDNLPDHFIHFKPKDIVSGDFYWATKKNDKFYLAVCDSTGHGVPGAFMSLLNIGFLSEAINEKDIKEPNEVFNYVRQRLTDTISKEGQKDGFDGILICLDQTTKQITYSAANNTPILVQNGELFQLGADRMPVGIGERKEDFKLFKAELRSGDTLFLYTDGYADQFGGPKGKKFKYKTLNQLILANINTPLDQQKNVLETSFEVWRGNLEQVDDVCIIGIRF